MRLPATGMVDCRGMKFLKLISSTLEEAKLSRCELTELGGKLFQGEGDDCMRVITRPRKLPYIT
jgi:hypothetical protein